MNELEKRVKAHRGQGISDFLSHYRAGLKMTECNTNYITFTFLNEGDIIEVVLSKSIVGEQPKFYVKYIEIID